MLLPLERLSHLSLFRFLLCAMLLYLRSGLESGLEPGAVLINDNFFLGKILLLNIQRWYKEYLYINYSDSLEMTTIILVCKMFFLNSIIWYNFISLTPP